MKIKKSGGKKSKGKDMDFFSFVVGNGKKNSPTLFEVWISKKLRNYTIPQRQGTRRGDSIGFGPDKHRATFYSLTKLKIKVSAESAGISYGVLRKWRTEDSFKAAVMTLEDEYTNLFCEYILQDHAKPCQSKVSVEDIIRKSGAWTRAFADTMIYSKSLQNKIAFLIQGIFQNKNKVNQQRWKKVGIPKPTNSDRMLFFAVALSTLDESFKKNIWNIMVPGFKKYLLEKLRDFIEKPKSIKPISKQDALFIIKMLAVTEVITNKNND